jgi:stage II sporulation protein P
VGDEYLNEDNRFYRVYQIRGDVARVKFVRREKLELADDRPTLMMQWIAAIESLWRKDNDNVQTPPGKRSIAVYYTHSDESYVPTDGRSSIEGKGTIFKVGSNLASEFRKIGVPVIDDKTPHDPHDAMAYDRSRRTAVQLLKRRPLALLDCHRDAVPPQEYRKVLNNQEVTKVRIVIGRQNPNMAANNAFAKQVKAVVDRKYPGMVRGIYYGKGAYNQDLAPRAILLEFGAHTNSRYAAERGSANRRGHGGRHGGVCSPAQIVEGRGNQRRRGLLLREDSPPSHGHRVTHMRRPQWGRRTVFSKGKPPGLSETRR